MFACLSLLLVATACGQLNARPVELARALPTPTPDPAVLPTDTLSPFQITMVLPTGLFTEAAPLVVTATPEPSLTILPVLLPTDTAIPPTPEPVPTDPPAPPGPQDFITFAVIGDYGLAGPAQEKVSALVKSWGPDFIITTGDNNYPSGGADTIDANIGQYYHAYIAPYYGAYGSGSDINRFFPTLGNHEYYTSGAQPYFDYFTLPGNERYYDFTWGPVHFFALNSDPNEPDGVGRSSDQAAWFQERLAGSTLPWKIVYFHHAPYSSGLHGSTDWSQWPYQEWGATAVITGHDHSYERLVIDGFPYFVNGLGGGAIYGIASELPGSEFQYDRDHGAMRVTASPSGMLFEFLTVNGEVVDSFAISR